MQAAYTFGYKIIILGIVLALLPCSPFQGMLVVLDQVPFLSYINWFIPIAEISAVVDAWLLIVLGYYAYMFILRACNGLKGS